MTKTIFNTYVPMESQEQCDRMKKVCIDNGLDIWKDSAAFKCIGERNYFFYLTDKFAVWASLDNKTKVTESEWLELLKQHKNK